MASLLIGARTNPHFDFAERGRQAADIMRALIEGEYRLTKAISQPPMLPSLQKQRIGAGGPMDELIGMAGDYLEQHAGLADITVMGGWPFADCSFSGLSVMVTTRDDEDLAEHIAKDLGSAAWARRERFEPEVHALDEAVRLALDSESTPVVLGGDWNEDEARPSS